MGHMSYSRVVRRCSGTRGFRVNSKRFSVQRLRERFLYFFRLFTRWRSSYGQALKSLKKVIGRSSSKNRSSRRSLVMKEVPEMTPSEYRLRSYGRSNSFYSEAIADCLEFIKRTSLSVDDHKPPSHR